MSSSVSDGHYRQVCPLDDHPPPQRSRTCLVILRDAARLVFTALGVAMIVVALVSPELSTEFKGATIVLALIIGAIIGFLGDGEDV